MTDLFGRLAAAFRRRPAVAAACPGGCGRAAAPRRRRRARGGARLPETGTAWLEAVIAARFDALDAAMAARAQAQLLTLAQLIGEAIVAECRGARARVTEETADTRAVLDRAGDDPDRRDEAPTGTAP